MSETIILPSPNWFLVSGLAVSNDGWLVYGGPTKSLCVLEPLQPECGVIRGESTKFNAHIFIRVHLEKIISVNISPEWPRKKLVLTGSADGSVKQWDIDELLLSNKVKPTHSHEVHSQDKEEVVGVGYSNDTFAITVGSFGNIVKWDLKSNVVKTYNLLKTFKPVCMSCSPHVALNVGIGTKQGVVFVVDLNGEGKVIFKVRCHDDEIVNLSWCPTYEVIFRKMLKDSDKRSNKAKNKKTEPLPEDKSDMKLEESGTTKELPEDSFDKTLVEPEDDMFDIYKDHEADEFGHKKYQPEEILVKVPKECPQNDYLDECSKLKEEIMNRKVKAEISIGALVEALDKSHLDDKHDKPESSEVLNKESSINASKETLTPSSAHVQKHLLATIGKYGGVRVWSKSGKLVSSCAVASINNKNQKNKIPFWPTLLWYKPDVLLLSDGKNQLLECNPLKLDCKNKLDFSVIHALHKRGIYCIASNAPRVQKENENKDWFIWTTSQDRYLVQYSLSKRDTLSFYATCGGYVYTVASCPYDAGKLAVSAADGAVRVWETSTLEDDDTILKNGQITSYWQNVQGKVLVVAWHPTRENLLAFATAESRIGLIDTSGKVEKPARALPTALSHSIYSISWGEKNYLYACDGKDLVRYNTSKPDDMPENIPVVIEGSRWDVSCVKYTSRGLAVGSLVSAVGLLTAETPHQVMAATIVGSKMIQMMEWHPQQPSDSNDESPLKNLLAVCSREKHNGIIIVEFKEREDNTCTLQTLKTLTGHRMMVLQLMWNPHENGRLLSTSQDRTVRVWDVVKGECTAIFAGHDASSVGATWSSFPALRDTVFSGGSDFSLRVWNANNHPPHNYQEEKHDLPTVKRDRLRVRPHKEKKEPEHQEVVVESTSEHTGANVATALETKLKGPKKFLLSSLFKQTTSGSRLQGAKVMLKKYVEKNFPEKVSDFEVDANDTFDLEYLKMFGSINDVNELLDKEMERHLGLGNGEAWMMLAVFRGHIDTMVRFAAERDLLCPYLLSLAPCVSYKYWKDATQLYLAQIDRLVAKGEEAKLTENRHYGGPLIRKVATLLSIHDIKGALKTLTEANLYKEAYILCRTRYMDALAKEILEQWATYASKSGICVVAAVCYLALENMSMAAMQLGKINDEEALSLAAQVAKLYGNNLYADHIASKRETIMSNSKKIETEEILKDLPTRMEAMMYEKKTVEGIEVVNGKDANGE